MNTSILNTEAQLNSEQLKAFNKMLDFFNSSCKIFILKGYAGTGKTTLIRHLTEHLDHEKREFMVMAPTGRAAKILREKTGFGTTIHQGIYNLEKLVTLHDEVDDDAERSFHYHFPIRQDDLNDKVIIVDESSMISSRESRMELFTFGTNILLDDLLTYARPSISNRKIIFVGDPAQLPPVGDPDSNALNAHYFQGLGLKCKEFTLTQVMRQTDNLILKNAMSVRQAIENNGINHLKFETDGHSFIELNPDQVVHTYTQLFSTPEPGDGAIIAFSNAQTYWYNHQIRERLYPGNPQVCPGDLLLINQNNYSTYPVPLYNGDIVKVVEADHDIITISAPVILDQGGTRVSQIVSLQMRKVRVRYPGFPDEFDVQIIDSHLHSIARDLSIAERKMLYIQFVIRFRNEQQKRKESGLPTHPLGSDVFKEMLKSDPYFNALNVKFGYSITGHKAQGGEWDKVIVDYNGRISLKPDPLRWCYTSTTRGINVVYAVNSPNFGPLSAFTISPVGQIGNLPAEAISFDHIARSPFHSPNSHRCKSAKYWEIMEKLENTDFNVESVESFPFMERYFIRHDSQLINLEGHHTGSGHFRHGFHVTSNTSTHTKSEIEELFNLSYKNTSRFTYAPLIDQLVELYSIMQSFCDALNIEITNIIERQENFYVTYYLVTDSLCAYIQFYFNGNGLLTRAIPKTYQCQNDQKLDALLLKLTEHART